MSKRLGVGIVGLGRRWQRYRQALLRLQPRLPVRAVFDPLARRAEAVAKLFGCTPAGGCSELLERPDVEAVLLFDRRWFGLWPLERACAFAKPVFCAIPLAADDPHADRVRAAVGAARLPVLMSHPLVGTPALDRLRGLLAGSLGPPRLICASCRLRVPAGRSVSLVHTAAAAGLLSACADLLGTSPTQVRASRADSGEAVSLLLEHPEGRLAQISLCCGPAVVPACRIEVHTARGSAVARLPRRLRWHDAHTQYAERCPCPSPAEALLQSFAEALGTGRALQPTFEDAYHSLNLLRAALACQSVPVVVCETQQHS